MLALVAACFGAIIGSFLNVVILRRGAQGLGGRSACGSCGRQLAWFDMVPVLSWLVLRGRCRTCGSRISIQYPLVEAATAALFALIFAAPLPLSLQAAAALVACLSVIITAYDLRHTIIPDEWAMVFGALALLYAWLAGALSLAPLSALLAGPIAAAPFFVLWAVSRGAWMGLGDAKLALGVGWFLGILDGIRVVILSFMLGAVVSVAILLPLPYLIHVFSRGRASFGSQPFTMKSEVPFGPFLVAAMWLVWLSGAYGIGIPLLVWQ